MKEKQLNPNLVSAILLSVTAFVIFVISPFTIRVETNTSAAQTPTTVEYTLKTIVGQTPPMAFIGVGGTIDGVINPQLTANVGDTVKITVINGDPIQHDLTIDEFNVSTGPIKDKDQTATITFTADKGGDFKYYCATPGHRQVGMEGVLHITGTTPAQTASTTNTMSGMPMMNAAAQATAAPADANAVSITQVGS